MNIPRIKTLVEDGTYSLEVAFNAFIAELPNPIIIEQSHLTESDSVYTLVIIYREVLADKCIFSGKCTREDGGRGCPTCPDNFHR